LRRIRTLLNIDNRV